MQALLLAALGTPAGLLLAVWFTPALVALSPEGSDATGSVMREFDYTVRLDGSGGMKLIFFGRFETHGFFGGFSSAASLKKVLLRRVDFLPPANRIEE
jgi:hypothetical protein